MAITVPPPAIDIVGRDAELEALAQALRAAGESQPRVVVVHGEAGVGKTTLVEHFVSTAGRDGALVLVGRCVHLGREGLPLAPVIDALRDLVRQVGKHAFPDTLPGAASLAGLLPDFDGPAGDQSPGRLAVVLTALLEQLAHHRPVVLVVEDLHWADPATGDVLDLLARSLRGSRVLVVLTCRIDDPGRERVRTLLAELERLRHVVRIDVERFDRSHTARLVRTLLGDGITPERVDDIHGRSAGNPFFALQLAYLHAAGNGSRLTRSLREVLRGRLDGLGPAARRLLDIAAVGGERVHHRQLAGVAGSTGDVDAAVREALAAHVLSVDGDHYTFSHALLREAVYDDLPPGERARLHRRYAQVVQQLIGSGSPGPAAAELAYHWCHADAPEEALPALVRAADAAGAVHAYGEQTLLLGRAVGLSTWLPTDEDRSSLLGRAATAARLAGERERALDWAEQALALVKPATDPRRAAVLLAHRARLLLSLSRGGALAAAERARDLLPPGDSAARVIVLDTLTAALEEQRRTTDAVMPAREAVAIATTLGDVPLQITARTTLGVTLARLHQFDDALTELRAACSLADNGRDLTGLARAHLNITFVLWTLGRYSAAIEEATATVAVAAQAGLARTHGSHAATFAAASLVSLGRWDDAARMLDRILDEDPTGGIALYPLLVRADLALKRGDLDTTKRLITDARALASRHGMWQGELLAAGTEAGLALAEHRLDDARRIVMDGLRRSRTDDRVLYVWALLDTALAVDAAHRADPVAPADATGDRLLATARGVAGTLPVATPPWRAAAAHFCAALDSRQRPSPAWTQVVAAWEAAGDPYRAAVARLRAADAAAAAGDRLMARNMLATATEQADALGAAPLMGEIAAFARRLGLRPPAGSTAHDPGVRLRQRLTPKEAEVLRLLATGRSNREIGTELYISDKTASVHVSRILAKLGVQSRAQAAALVHRLHMFDLDAYPL